MVRAALFTSQIRTYIRMHALVSAAFTRSLGGEKGRPFKFFFTEYDSQALACLYLLRAKLQEYDYNYVYVANVCCCYCPFRR